MESAATKPNLKTVSSNTIFAAPEGVDALWLAKKAEELMRDDRVLMHIALDDQRIETLKTCLEFFVPEAEVLVFPAWDCLPFDRVAPNREIIGQRVATLCRLLEIDQEKARKPRILLTSINAITQKITPKSFFDHARFYAKRGGRLDVEALQQFLVQNGYERTDTVREHGEFAIRGGLIDLYPPSYEEPLRLDLFGDELESIRTFDPADQTTTGKRDGFDLTPVTEFILSEESIARFRSRYRDAFGVAGTNDPVYEAVSEGRRYNGVEHWLPLFFDEMAELSDYVPNAFVTQDYHGDQAYDERLSQIKDFYNARLTMMEAQAGKKKKNEDVSLSGTVYRPLEWQALYTEFKHPVLTFSPFQDNELSPNALSAGGKKGRDFSDIRALPDGDVIKVMQQHIAHLATKPVLISAYSNGSRDRIKHLIDNHKILSVKEVNSFAECKKLSGQIGLIILPLEQGFETNDLAIITEQDLLGDRLTRTSKTKKRKSDNFIREVSSLAVGDYVVHVDFGIGRFEGLETLSAAGALHDCLKLTYAGDDRLFIPVENIEMLSRFGGEGALVQLDKLGGTAWQARKARVKKNLMEMADDLLKIAAARQLKQADRLDISEGIYNEFATRFPYHETDDQLRAINETLEDLGKGLPMDRLICGDVGFGKTEVAIRAAYVAVMAGAQVAIVAPTTLLAQQHTNNFIKRFAGTGIKIAQLSRMVSHKESKATKDALKDGTVNIVIGTHALFSDSIAFQKLGLLIVDEEQRFGVKQKEKLKQLKENVHVLTLTATPIPRTLQMSLTGVKEMSIIATPPVDRLAVRTFVLPFDPMVIREALLREHYRGGQSFYVCPRVKDIEKLHQELKTLVPEVKIVAAHGQLTPGDLDERMTAFYERQYDVLLATNIIESGLDVPTANTMIVHRADMFGLAQLYQIRGRVGRSKVRAYAYLTYAPDKVLNPIAQKRLEVLETLDTLGAGFQLASHDMDIRGAGNLLGEQQSGHVREVGVELYQQMLEDAVAAARMGAGFDEAIEESWSPTIQLGTSVLIPETYVNDLSLRMSLYRRIGDLETSEDIERFAAELIDRFGALPNEVDNLLTVIGIKQLCKKAGIEKVEAGPKGAVISFHKSFDRQETLVQLLQRRAGFMKLRPDQKLVYTASWTSTAERVKGVKSLIAQILES